MWCAVESLALRACAELGINRISYASSVNALGLEYSRFPSFDYLCVPPKAAFFGEEAGG